MTPVSLSLHQRERLDALLAAMTWDEKIAQLRISFAIGADATADLVRAGMGAIFWPGSAEAVREAQRVAREETRLGIPLLIGLDVIHGHRTIFPIPLAQACSFDPDLAEDGARIAAAEASSAGISWTFSPMIDVARDARWGRVCEGFGEDPLLSSAFGAALVRGYQGGALDAPGSILACAKHFVGYGAAEGGRDYNTVDMSEYRLRNTYLRPFRAAVAAGAATVMASFNTVSGRPVHANRDLLTRILKEEWDHAGLVVGDADGVKNLIAHGVAETITDALRTSLLAGLDVEMGIGIAEGDRPPLEEDPALTARVDDALRRLLALKFALGLFDGAGPVTDEILEAPPAHREVARRAAERSAVLLRNDGSLPLAAGARRILLAGPYGASTDHLGAWVQRSGAPATSLADALREVRPGLGVTVLPGASFYEPDPAAQEAVVAAAPEHDLVILALGEPSDLSGEASSRADLRLPGDQEALIRAVADSGAPFVVVLVTGRPLVVADWIGLAPTVLAAGHLGTEAAPALARLLCGEANPAGRLAMSWPRAVGQLPLHYDHENTGRPPTRGGQISPKDFDFALDGPANIQEFYTSKYRDLELGPQFAFGHGGSYSTFRHGAPAVAPGEISVADLGAGRRVRVRATVGNTSGRDGDEVVLVFIRDVVASLAQPVRRLAAFRRFAVPAGQERTVELDFGFDELAFWAGDGAGFRVEPGVFEIHVGPSLAETQLLTLRVV